MCYSETQSYIHAIIILTGSIYVYTKNRLTIFCYHDVSNNPSEFSHSHDLNVPPSIFEYQIGYINKKFNV